MNLKMNFKYFQIQKWMLQADRAEKIDEKWGHLCSFHVPFLSYNPLIVEKVKFSIVYWPQEINLAKYVKEIYIDASERSRYPLSENVIIYYAMT